MVAYSFQRQFAPPIVAGVKKGTIRRFGARRHARPGEVLQLYTGMRTRTCRLLGTASAIHVRAIQLHLDADVVLIADGMGVPHTKAAALDQFAQTDGFEDWSGLKAFWGTHHRAVGPFFAGVQIIWGDSFVAADAESAAA